MQPPRPVFKLAVGPFIVENGKLLLVKEQKRVALLRGYCQVADLSWVTLV